MIIFVAGIIFGICMWILFIVGQKRLELEEVNYKYTRKQKALDIFYAITIVIACICGAIILFSLMI